MRERGATPPIRLRPSAPPGRPAPLFHGGTMQARHARPVIAIHHDSYPAVRSMVHPGYFDVVQAVGGLPVLLSTLAREAEIDTCLERVQAVILDGAPDLDPDRPNHAATLLLRRA